MANKDTKLAGSNPSVANNHYIACPECGETVSVLYKLMDEIIKININKMMSDKNQLSYDPSKLLLKQTEDYGYLELFDALELNRCCRIRLLCRSNIRVI